MYKNEEQYKKLPKFLFFVAVFKCRIVGQVSDLFPVSYQGGLTCLMGCKAPNKQTKAIMKLNARLNSFSVTFNKIKKKIK